MQNDNTHSRCPGALIVGAFIIGIAFVVVPMFIVAGQAGAGGMLTAAGVRLLTGAFVRGNSGGGC